MKSTRVLLPYRPDYEPGEPIDECLGCGATFSGEHATLCSVDPAGARRRLGRRRPRAEPWRRSPVLSVTGASGGRLHIRFTDGTEAVADRAAERYVLDQSDPVAA